MKAWREAGYPGVTGITAAPAGALARPDGRDSLPFFFCQLEAIETLIWLAEAPPADRQGIAIPSDGGPFSRVCSKMATGSGKTIVMAMLIAWQVLNKVTYPQDDPVLEERLRRRPGSDGQAAGCRCLYPTARATTTTSSTSCRRACTPRTPAGPGAGPQLAHAHELGDRRQIGQAKERRQARRQERRSLCPRRAGRDGRRPELILVINDEAHHAWRVPAEVEGQGREPRTRSRRRRSGSVASTASIARRGILTCYDFSATPFAPSGKQEHRRSAVRLDRQRLRAERRDRVGAGQDAAGGRSATTASPGQDYKSRLYHIYNDPDVKDDLNRKAEEHEPLPDLVTNGYYLLGKDWLETAKEWETAGSHDAAGDDHRRQSHRDGGPGQVRLRPRQDPHRRTARPGADAAHRLEGAGEGRGADDEAAEVERPARRGERRRGSRRKRPRREADQGGAGRATARRWSIPWARSAKPGEQIQNVISVGMLSEGWDAKTVTHIMGLRAFTSQLLCEQVVGRGLRRTSYEVDRETGLFEPEYVNIFGVPFTFLPHEGGDGPPPPPPPPKTQIEPDRREAAVRDHLAERRPRSTTSIRPS